MKWQNSVLTANLVKHCASGRKATNTETEHKETDNESGTLSQQEYIYLKLFQMIKTWLIT